MIKSSKIAQKEVIKDKIYRAFPDKISCLESSFILDKNPDNLSSEKKLVLRFFKDKSWKTISLESIIAVNNTPLICFNEKAFNYYLPAYMVLIIDYYDDFSGFLPVDSLINELTPHKHLSSIESPNDDYLHRKKRFEGLQKLTKQQKECVKLFLEFMNKEYSEDLFDKDYSFGEIEESSYILPSPALALELYWTKA